MSDPDKIIGMLKLTDLHLAKAIFAGIGLASILLFISLKIGLVSPEHISIKSLYSGVFVGGLIFGIGWAVSGFCPGTGLVSVGAKRLDAVFFILGGFIGTAIFMIQYAVLSKTWLFKDILGGKITLVQTGAEDALINSSIAPFIALVIGVVFIVASALLPLTFKQPQTK